MNARCSAVGIAGLVLWGLGVARAEVVLNGDSETSDFHASVVRGSDGSSWVAWHGYRERADRIYARQVSAAGVLGETMRLDEGGGVPGPPEVVEGVDGEIFVAWAEESEGRWGVRVRRWNDGIWGDVVVLSGEGNDAIYPTVAKVRGGVMAAWSERVGGEFWIVRRTWKEGKWGERVVDSAPGVDAFRPGIVSGKGRAVWMSWDECEGKRFRVRVKKILPEAGPSEVISAEGVDGMNATLLLRDSGVVIAAWLEKYDVIGGEGAISQWHTLHAAVRTENEWKVVLNAEGGRAGAELTQGLMAMIAPKAVATGGYLGRRTTPMLLDDKDEVWLLWERKSSQGGSTPNVTGDLCGRPIGQGRWGEALVLAEGKVDYHLVDPARAEGGRFDYIASALPQEDRRPYSRMTADLGEGAELVQAEWVGWEPVALPVEEELTERREIELGGTRYELFWADMHCHNGLTTDAEGHPDELNYYARDRAKLDVVVFTNNDYLYNTFLTEYEYALGNFFAGIFTEEGTFLSLPGFEWTARVPGVGGVPFSDPSTWTPPYQNRSYPNHRSIVYPPAGGPLLRFPEVGNDIGVLHAAVEKAGGVSLTQHNDFLPSGHAAEVAMELTSGWSNYIDRKSKPFYAPLNEGARLGFVANGDSHRRAPGLSGALTGIYAEELTAEAILDALRARRCFATDGSRVFLDARANGVLMGDVAKVEAGKEVRLTLEVEGTRPIESVVLVRDGEEVQRFSGNGGKKLEVDYVDGELAPGKHWYYWRVVCEGEGRHLPGNVEVAFGKKAWSSPLYVVVE